MKYITLFILPCSSTTVLAGSWTNKTTIDYIQVNTHVGMTVSGAFGNHLGCYQEGEPKGFWISKDHPQYSELLMAMNAAYIAQKPVRAFTHECDLQGENPEATERGFVQIFK